jgi:fructose-specific phosphotransferase system IIA component
MKVTVPVFGIDIDETSVLVFQDGLSKHDVLDRLVDAVFEAGTIQDKDAFRDAVHDRERVLSTGIGHGVAIPHVRIDAVTRPTLGIGVSAKGIDFDTIDDAPVHVVFMFAMPTGSQKEYLGLLSKVMQAVKKPDFNERLTACSTPGEVLEALSGSED